MSASEQALQTLKTEIASEQKKIDALKHDQERKKHERDRIDQEITSLQREIDDHNRRMIQHHNDLEKMTREIAKAIKS